MAGWYDDGSEEQAQAERALAKEFEKVLEGEAASRLARESEKLHELRRDAAEVMFEALKGAEQIICRAISVLEEVRAALAKAEGR